MDRSAVLAEVDLSGDAAQYLYVSGDAALAAIDIDDERAVECLELLP